MFKNFVRTLFTSRASSFNELLIERINADDTEGVKALITEGVNIHYKNELALRTAADRYNTDLIRLLVDNGADVKVDENYVLRKICDRTGLDIEVDVDFVRYLVSKGADIRVNNDELLQTAARVNNLLLFKYLLDKGADIHVNQDYPLYIAMERGLNDIIEESIHRSADVNAREGYPIKKASERGHLITIMYLKDFGADIHVSDEEPLKLAALHGHLDVVKFFIENRCEIDSENYYAFKIAAKNGHFELVEYLLPLVLDFNVRYDAFLMAIINGGHYKIVTLLSDRGLTDENRDNGLALGSYYGHINIVKYLIRIFNVDPTSLNNLPIKSAIKFGYLDIIKTLLKAGVDFSEAIDIAISLGKPEIADYINKLKNLASEENTPEIAECAVCLESKEMVPLSCFKTHTVCNSCISIGELTQCPLCRELIAIW
jgi:ankyrin repeat protein